MSNELLLAGPGVSNRYTMHLDGPVMWNHTKRIAPFFKLPVAEFIVVMVVLMMTALVVGWPVDSRLCVWYMAVAVKLTTALTNQNQYTKQDGEAVHGVNKFIINVLKRADTHPKGFIIRPFILFFSPFYQRSASGANRHW